MEMGFSWVFENEIFENGGKTIEWGSDYMLTVAPKREWETKTLKYRYVAAIQPFLCS